MFSDRAPKRPRTQPRALRLLHGKWLRMEKVGCDLENFGEEMVRGESDESDEDCDDWSSVDTETAKSARVLKRAKTINAKLREDWRPPGPCDPAGAMLAPQCYICHQGREQSALFLVCSCRLPVHIDCLNQWRRASSHYDECERCHVRYRRSRQSMKSLSALAWEMLPSHKAVAREAMASFVDILGFQCIICSALYLVGLSPLQMTLIFLFHDDFTFLLIAIGANFPFFSRAKSLFIVHLVFCALDVPYLTPCLAIGLRGYEVASFFRMVYRERWDIMGEQVL